MEDLTQLSRDEQVRFISLQARAKERGLLVSLTEKNGSLIVVWMSEKTGKLVSEQDLKSALQTGAAT